jgi:hypothetical protein
MADRREWVHGTKEQAVPMKSVAEAEFEVELIFPKIGGWNPKPVNAIERAPRPIGSRALKQASRSLPARGRTAARTALATSARQVANRKYGHGIPQFRIGEIKPDSRSGRSAGVTELNSGIRATFPGSRALVTYDRHGNVFATVWDQRAGRVWNGVLGIVPPREMPRGILYGDPAFGTRIENPVRRVVQRATGRRYRVKHGSARGPDLLPVSRRR